MYYSCNFSVNLKLHENKVIKKFPIERHVANTLTGLDLDKHATCRPPSPPSSNGSQPSALQVGLRSTAQACVDGTKYDSETMEGTQAGGCGRNVEQVWPHSSTA